MRDLNSTNAWRDTTPDHTPRHTIHNEPDYPERGNPATTIHTCYEIINWHKTYRRKKYDPMGWTDMVGRTLASIDNTHAIRMPYTYNTHTQQMQYTYNPNTIQTQHKHNMNTNTIHMHCKCNEHTRQMHYKGNTDISHNTNTVHLQYKWDACYIQAI